MLEGMKAELRLRKSRNVEEHMLAEMVNESEFEDDFLNAIDEEDLTTEEETKYEEILTKIPEYEAESEEITSKDVKEADNDVHDPSLDDLVDDIAEA